MRVIRLALWAGATLLLLAAVAERSTAQTQPPSSRSRVTTMSGVFTTAQANRGEEMYMNLCVGCHTVAAYTGSSFNVMWGKRPVSDLFTVIKDTMPKSDAGSLSNRETAQLVAYMLKINRIPAGKTELPGDSATLRNIQIETPSMRSGKNERPAAGLM